MYKIINSKTGKVILLVSKQKADALPSWFSRIKAHLAQAGIQFDIDYGDEQ